MPVACGNTVLTGDSGSVAFTPAGTSVCLLDYTDFPTATPGVIQLPAGHGFLVGDVVQFSAEGGATLVTGLAAELTTLSLRLIAEESSASFGHCRWYAYRLHQQLCLQTLRVVTST